MNVRNGRNLEASLQNLSFAGRNLQVNVAKFERKQKKRVGDFRYRSKPVNTKTTSEKRSNIRDGRTFASVVAGCDMPPPPPPPPPPSVNPISLHPNAVMAEWVGNDLTFLGEAISMEHVHSLNPGISMGDDEAFSLKYVGGLKVCLSFRSIDDVNAFLRVKDDWFLTFSRANLYQNHFDRVTWVKIFGMPLKLWDRRNFDCIAGKFGRVLVPFEASPEARDLSHGRLCILTESRKRIDDEVLIECDGQLSNVSVLEYDDGLFPLNSTEFVMNEEDDELVDFSENEDDSVGISDTVMIEDDEDEIEDGEIVGVDTENVEDSFRGTTAGEEFADQSREMVGDAPAPMQPSINYSHEKNRSNPGEPQQPLRNSPTVVNSGYSKEDNSLASDNLSFGDLKNLIPNGCFGPFNSKWATPPHGGPVNSENVGQDFGKLNDTGHLDTLGPNAEFSGSYAKRRKIRNITQADRNIPPPPNFESDEPPMDTQEINFHKSPSHPVSNNTHFDPTIISTPEIMRTARIGRAIGFDIDGDNEILIAAMGETGACNHNR
ncbi:hypothetical protein L2E82_14352 [Cichorium intybus]|uniref:Uncharacterized protein n=1 Tax=Cichorium intybus TaxID=13427 RepID=A0ACB9F0D1_CICIN|nr:hypothetical protein L2E82_14352 [Cichorium intybus]